LVKLARSISSDATSVTVSIIADPICSDRIAGLHLRFSERDGAVAVPLARLLSRDSMERKETRMKRYDPQDPRANEPGDHPQMGERKGLWKVGSISLVLVIIALIVIGFWFL